MRIERAVRVRGVYLKDPSLAYYYDKRSIGLSARLNDAQVYAKISFHGVW